MRSPELPLSGPLTPNVDQLQALAAAPDDRPVVMLNLLKFKPGGADSYARYGDAAREMIEARGGSLLWSGRAERLQPGADVSSG